MKGQRRLLVSPELLVGFLKGPGERRRSFTVERALPEDATIVGLWLAGPGDRLEIRLESGAWTGSDDQPLESPLVTVHLEG